MHEDIGATIIRLYEAEALVGVEEFNNASLGHASGPFSSARMRRAALQCLPKGRAAGSSRL
jgi:hypothetical protein